MHAIANLSKHNVTFGYGAKERTIYVRNAFKKKTRLPSHTLVPIRVVAQNRHPADARQHGNKIAFGRRRRPR